jgi:molecular chaperone GrpE
MLKSSAILCRSAKLLTGFRCTRNKFELSGWPYNLMRVSFMSDQKPSSEEPVNEVQEDTEVIRLKESLKKMELEVKEMKDKVIRSYAEEENVRRIAKRDVENAKAYAISSFAKSLLDVADNLDLALSAVSKDSSNENDPAKALTNLVQGVRMTNDGLLKVFAQFGIVKVLTVNK